MVQSRATTPAREKTPAVVNPGYSFCPRTGVKVQNGWSLDPKYNGSIKDRPDALFCGGSGKRLFKFCFRTGLPVGEVTCGKTGKYLVPTLDGAGKPLPCIFCTGSGNFLGSFCPITGKNKALGTKDSKLIAKTWDPVMNTAIPHKYCIWSGDHLKSTSDPGPRASSPTKSSTIKKQRSSSAGKSISAPRSPIKPLPPTTLKLPKKVVAKKARSTKIIATAASKRPKRATKQTVPFTAKPFSHPAVKKTAKKAAPKKKTTGTGVKKAPAKKAAATPKKAAPEKAAPKKAAAKKIPAKKAPAKKPAAKKTGAGVKKAAAKPKANTKKKAVPKKM